MIIKRYILTILITGIAFMAVAQEREPGELLVEQVEKYGQVEVTFEYPGFNELTEIGKFISVSNIKDNLVHCVLSGKDISTFLAFNLNYKIVSRTESKAVESALSVEEAMNWDLYPTYPQYDTIIHKLADDYPFLCRVDTIGQSIEGRLILALKISDNVYEDEDEPEVFYTSNIHGDELAGMVLMLRLSEICLVAGAFDAGKKIFAAVMVKAHLGRRCFTLRIRFCGQECHHRSVLCADGNVGSSRSPDHSHSEIVFAGWQ